MSFQLDTVCYAPELNPDHLLSILKKTYGILDAELVQLSGYEDKNYRVKGIRYLDREGPETLILKVSNSIEADCSGHIDFQVKFCSLLNEATISAPMTFPTADGRDFSVEEVSPNVSLPIRLFQVLPGSILEEFEFTPELVQKIGACLGLLHKIADESGLTTAHIPCISAEYSDILRQEANLLHSLGFVNDGKLKMVEDGLSQYEALKEMNLDRGVIHSDINETNVLISSGKITGVLDFGDVHVAPRAMDIGSLILYLHLSDRLEQGFGVLSRNVLSGYRSSRPFSDADESILACMRVRMSCSLIYGLRTVRMRGEGSDSYVLKTQGPGWKALDELLSRKHL